MGPCYHCMDWISANLGEAFELFQKLTQLYFFVKDIPDDKEIDHIILLSGEEVLRCNSLWCHERADSTRPTTITPAIVWKHFEAELMLQKCIVADLIGAAGY